MKAPFLKQRAGFTLIELIVVITLMGIMMFTAIPRFQQIMTDSDRSVARWLIGMVPLLKQQAVSEKKRYVLHVDMDTNRLWVSHDTMTDEERESAFEDGYLLPEDLQLLDVEFPGNRVVTAGSADIFFHPKGHSDRAIIHLATGDNEKRSYVVEPFLTRVKLREYYAGFAD